MGMMIRDVCSELKAPVEKAEITTAQTTAGHQSLSQRIYLIEAAVDILRPQVDSVESAASFDPVIWRLSSNDHVVNVTFAQPGR